MSPQAKLALILWLPIIFYIFTRFPPRTAVIISFIGGLLFLPQRASFALPLIPDYGGAVATCYGIVLAIIVYDAQRLSSFKFGWVDLPMLVWCICPFFSSMTNGLGAYDGFNSVLEQTAKWGLPYFLGRIYLNNLAGLKELAINIWKGGLIYMPLCIWEGRMSPNLHLIVYGYYAHPSGIAQSVRYGGYRPNVFMEHGLMLGMWMMTATFIGIWLWKAGVLKEVWGQSMNVLVWVMLFTVVWCRSTGAYIYILLGVVILFTAKWWRTAIPLLLLIAGLSYYLYAGATGTFAGDEIVAFISKTFNPDRAQSLEFRWHNEDILGEKARQRMMFGWGGWNRNRVFKKNWEGVLEDVSITDSLWIIAFGVNGAVGLASLTTSLLLPVASFSLLRYPPKTWFNPKVAPAAAMAVALTLFMLDCVLNNMFLPVFPLISGGLSGIVLKQPESLKGKTKQSKGVKRSLAPQRQRQRRLVAGRASAMKS
jgi:hypothetical protein